MPVMAKEPTVFETPFYIDIIPPQLLDLFISSLHTCSESQLGVRTRRTTRLLLIVPALGEQFADVHHSSRQVTGLNGGGPRLDGAGLPAAMILAEDIRIVGQQRFEDGRAQSRVTVSRRNRITQICFGLAPLALPDMQCGSCAEELYPVRRNCILVGGEDSDSAVQCLPGFAISPVGDVEGC